MEPYQALANAIVELAAKDYKTALKYHYKHPDKSEYAAEVDSLERFFRSGWYGMLTDLDGEYLMKGVQALVRKEVAA
ncbi:hypothetical protein [Intestinibacillus massiliensis]|uniref:hypothetical protein n=1 Tax=Intestinibacillus massiliensis TaxID=1871029 RepID=UPI000B360C3C|nr:hypothetical protein [Intestinibacillus massiliensis]